MDMVARAVAEELNQTPLHALHEGLGARFVGFAGWEMPVQYAGVKAEHHAVREAAGLFDVSHMGEIFFEGEGAAELLDRLVTNHVAALDAGRAVYTVCCNEQGTILDDLIIYRIEPQRFMVVCNASNRTKMVRHFESQAEGRCSITDHSEQTALIALQGPRARDIMKRAGAAENVLEMRPFDVVDTQLEGLPAIISCTGYTGEDGFELYCDWDRAPRLWQALMAAGKPDGLQAAGLAARDTLRLEACLALYGNDIDETTNPYEARLGWTVKLGKPAFVGRDALQEIKRRGPERRLVGFEMRGRGIARHGYPIVEESGSRVGIVTSGAPGLTVGAHIGLGYVPAAMAKAGTPMGVEIRGKVVEAEVVRTPFYKRQQ